MCDHLVKLKIGGTKRCGRELLSCCESGESVKQCDQPGPRCRYHHPRKPVMCRGGCGKTTPSRLHEMCSHCYRREYAKIKDQMARHEIPRNARIDPESSKITERKWANIAVALDEAIAEVCDITERKWANIGAALDEVLAT